MELNVCFCHSCFAELPERLAFCVDLCHAFCFRFSWVRLVPEKTVELDFMRYLSFALNR